MGGGKLGLTISAMVLVFGLGGGSVAQEKPVGEAALVAQMEIDLTMLGRRVDALEEVDARRGRQIDGLSAEVAEARHLAEMAGMRGP